MCVDEGLTGVFRLGEKAVQDMVGVVDKKTVYRQSPHLVRPEC